MEVPQIHVSVETTSGVVRRGQFHTTFRIGRDPSCDVSVDSPVVSRIHVEIVYENESWWLIDRLSRNGVFAGGERVNRLRITGETEVRLGQDGPTVRLSVEGGDARDSIPDEKSRPDWQQSPEQIDVPDRESPLDSARTFSESRTTADLRPDSGTITDPTSASAPPQDQARPARHRKSSHPESEPAEGIRDPEDYARHYLSGDSDRPAGEHTIMIRHAYQAMQQEQRKRHVATFAIVASVAILVAITAIVMVIRAEMARAAVERQLASIQYRMKDLELTLASTTDRAQRLALQTELAETRSIYEGGAEDIAYVREFGIRRELNEEEKLIWRVAYLFNEVQAEIPASFIKEVKRKIHGFWLRDRRTYEMAIQTAQSEGYIPYIVRALENEGLPREFFYLALQESKFDRRIVGPRTRYGYAKGMWQFIPETGERYGLEAGPDRDRRVYDRFDERHDFRKSTGAAAEYLRDIYTTLAQTSGLLVIASYNWGEHRVASKLEQQFEGIDQTPRSRSYWNFYREYSKRMPEETKDYVIKIFAAAVIGQDPRRFGFDFDNPLDLETASASVGT
ncbi:MAG: transglycosylase SLT domain-containing protein [Rhodothermales bacterium]|nr:transglycosylase SLT domain-containing protein [Rhodothermales bacterium]